MYYDDLDYMLEDMDMEDESMDDYGYDEDVEDYDDAYDEEAAYEAAMNEAYQLGFTEATKVKADRYEKYVARCRAKGKTPMSRAEWEARKKKARRAALIAGGAAAAAGALAGQHAYVKHQANKGAWKKGQSFKVTGVTRNASKRNYVNSHSLLGMAGSKASALKKKLFKEDPNLAIALYESGIVDPEMQMAFIEGYYAEY